MGAALTLMLAAAGTSSATGGDIISSGGTSSVEGHSFDGDCDLGEFCIYDAYVTDTSNYPPVADFRTNENDYITAGVYYWNTAVSIQNTASATRNRNLQPVRAYENPNWAGASLYHQPIGSFCGAGKTEADDCDSFRVLVNFNNKISSHQFIGPHRAK
ncbi:hypothetical protein [Streptomyces sp. NPDC056069]|uniref:hypothetical protein n=1 Tax=Streptomyces sp. NPDC056069 TaxID=3345702 RepID=UPI0035D8298A